MVSATSKTETSIDPDVADAAVQRGGNAPAGGVAERDGDSDDARGSGRGEADPADGIGERVAEQRRARGMKVSELARLVGVSPSLISQIERGQSRPSVSTLFALAEALRVPIDTFFSRENVGSPADPLEPSLESPAGTGELSAEPDEPPAAERRYLVRRDARAVIDIEGGVRWERLTPTTLHHVEFMELVYGPGSQSHETLYRHPGSEMVLVTSGQLDIYVGFDHFRLQAGDSIHFPSSRPHRYVNATRDVARAVSVILHDDATPSNQRQRRP